MHAYTHACVGGGGKGRGMLTQAPPWAVTVNEDRSCDNLAGPLTEDRSGEKRRDSASPSVCVCVWLCVREGGGEREREREKARQSRREFVNFRHVLACTLSSFTHTNTQHTCTSRQHTRTSRRRTPVPGGFPVVGVVLAQARNSHRRTLLRGGATK
jgi:hypothetical protein